jgi:23S rRNA (adenine2503-C2)-methyltransferase
MPLALQALTPAQLADAAAISLAEARKLVAQVHRGEPVHATCAVRRSAANAVRAIGVVPVLRVIETHASALDAFVKHVVASTDGARFECVRIPLEHPGRFTACVSSQVGCALGCAFCATGRMGLRRNLEAWEIVEQVRVVRAGLTAEAAPLRGASPPTPPARVHGVVFQGMGEPLANLDAVLAAIAVLTEPSALAIDARGITVCTAGLPAGIRRLAKQAPSVRLGISIASAIAQTRRSLMPIAAAHDLDVVLDAVADHARATGLSPMWAVTLLAGVNDSDADAHALVARARAFVTQTGKRPRISVLAYNPIGDDDPFVRSSREHAFRAILHAAALPSHRRYSGGADVAAACGQLALP